MDEPRTVTFEACLAMSQGVTENVAVASILLDKIPGALRVYPAHKTNDRQGVDWWIEHSSGKHLAVDCKIRFEDWALRGKDDVALETWSVLEERIQGWTLNCHKKCDYILWLWRDTGRYLIVPFLPLCYAFRKRVAEWSRLYPPKRQRTEYRNGRCYHSECIFVPREEIWRAIYEDFGSFGLRTEEAQTQRIEQVNTPGTQLLLFELVAHQG